MFCNTYKCNKIICPVFNGKLTIPSIWTNFYSQTGVLRKAFTFAEGQSFQHWFPAHMSRGLNKMKKHLRMMDCIIEVHDARIPFSGRNPILSQAVSSKPRIIVLNKTDLIQASSYQVETIYQHYKQEGVSQLLFTICHGDGAVKVHESVLKIIPACLDIVKRTDRYDREGDNDINLMIVGVPNVGKSTLINALRKSYLGLRPVVKVGKSPGQTKSVADKVQVCDSPTVFLLDTPGIFKAKVQSMDEGMKLAICNTIHDHIVGTPMISEYLLYLLNENVQHEYVKVFGIEKPTNCIRTVLKQIAHDNKRTKSHRVYTGTGPTYISTPNYDFAAAKFISAYREGRLGKFFLDDIK